MHAGLKWSLAAALAAGLSIGVYTQVSAQGDANQASVAQRRVTRSFDNAKLSEVLDWLKSQGVNFVVRPDQVDPNSRLSINAVNQPVNDVMSAIARAFGGSWTKEGELWVFRQGTSKGFAFSMPDLPDLPPIEWDGPKVRVWTDKDLEKDTEFKKWAEEWKKDWERWAEEWKSHAKDLDLKFGGPKIKVWTDKELEKDPEFKKWVEKWRADVEKSFGPEFQKKMELRAKEFVEKAKKFKTDESEMKRAKEEMEQELFRQGKALESKSLFLDDTKVRQLIESLSADQWAKQEVQGHLTLQDLTDMQRELIKDLPAEGTWSVSFSIDGKSVKLKAK
ncbi:MAG TPA: hypothetical protein PLL78_07185 [Fimbriimonadaceae bacterium]|nr:hypothetical protein [Fimbriimonadaceae bacterium]HRJ96455.1 hypothetical protein [Fimbriimonadaceae bacterium]